MTIETNKSPAFARAASAESWEAAYVSFETPDEEKRKFTRRLKKLGALNWAREAAVLELFCGRGSGLRALRTLGFNRIVGADVSPSLLQRAGRSEALVGCDARQLPFRDHCKDIVIVQGGLHHLHNLPSDLQTTLGEIRRVLKSGGQLVLVEPWMTPFLYLVHAVCANRLMVCMSRKLKALAEMIDQEKPTYDRWLGQPHMILGLLDKYFEVSHCSIELGKLHFVGKPRSA